MSGNEFDLGNCPSCMSGNEFNLGNCPSCMGGNISFIFLNEILKISSIFVKQNSKKTEKHMQANFHHTRNLFALIFGGLGFALKHLFYHYFLKTFIPNF